jgi:hypothetical protein
MTQLSHAFILLQDAIEHASNKNSRIALLNGNPAVFMRPVAFRPCFATGLAFIQSIVVGIQSNQWMSGDREMHNAYHSRTLNIRLFFNDLQRLDIKSGGNI